MITFLNRISTCNTVMLSTLCTKIRNYNVVLRRCNSASVEDNQNKFETVFSFPFVKYIASLNRLKVFHAIGTSVALPISGIMEMLNLFPEYTFLTTSYVGITGLIVLSAATLPFKNVIGFLYISENNKYIKISSVDFWGKRVDKIVSVDDWIPLLDMAPKKMDAFYLSPQLVDGSKYKLFVKFGNVLNSTKMGQVLE
ncbi:transmembrane protein 186-like [Manduca sexta]|uniref:transmembrane protein 186-like n=1 Tax=Manduca sexta TaxID=7130 RepID=UPI00118438B2|nr:transmembrane protein 186-like [Manduca sexta]